MSWHVHGSRSSVFDSDGYGCDTDLPLSAYEILTNALNAQSLRAIQDGYNDWVRDTAYEYFDTSDWDEEHWDAWNEIVRDNTY